MGVYAKKKKSITVGRVHMYYSLVIKNFQVFLMKYENPAEVAFRQSKPPAILLLYTQKLTAYSAKISI